MVVYTDIRSGRTYFMKQVAPHPILPGYNCQKAWSFNFILIKSMLMVWSGSGAQYVSTVLCKINYINVMV